MRPPICPIVERKRRIDVGADWQDQFVESDGKLVSNAIEWADWQRQFFFFFSKISLMTKAIAAFFLFWCPAIDDDICCFLLLRIKIRKKFTRKPIRFLNKTSFIIRTTEDRSRLFVLLWNKFLQISTSTVNEENKWLKFYKNRLSCGVIYLGE